MDRLDMKRRAFAQLIVNLPHGRIRVAEAGDLAIRGFSVVVDNNPPGHANIVLKVPPSDLILKRLDR